MNRDREDIQMVGLFVVIVVMRRLRPGAPQPPYGVARRHEPRKPVPRHDATRASRGAATSSRRYSQCSPRDNTRTGQDQQVGSRNQISRAALTKLTTLPDKKLYTTLRAKSWPKYHNRISQEAVASEASWTAAYVTLTYLSV